MNGKIDILLAPVIDRQGAWGGVWVKCTSGNADVIADSSEIWAETGGLHIFLDAGNPPPTSCLDTLPPTRTFIVDRGGDLQESIARGFHKVTFDQQFATEISDQAAFDAAKTKGAEWFCGEFLTHPPVVAGKKDSSRASLLKLLTLVAEDADSDEIEQVFKREPELSFNLFRLVNSVSMGLKTKISTFNQAIMVLGRRQMQRWLQLLLYTNNAGDNANNPLLQLAAMRARLMERLAHAKGWSGELQEQAFMAGIFSLLDTLLGISMAEIVTIISLPDDVQSALLRQGGDLSDLLEVVSQLQAGVPAELPSFMDISLESLAACQFDALKWAAGMSQEMG